MALRACKRIARAAINKIEKLDDNSEGFEPIKLGFKLRTCKCGAPHVREVETKVPEILRSPGYRVEVKVVNAPQFLFKNIAEMNTKNATMGNSDFDTLFHPCISNAYAQTVKRIIGAMTTTQGW